MSGEYFEASLQITPAAALWRHVFGTRPDLAALFTGYRKPGADALSMPSTRYYKPDELDEAEAWASQQDGINRDVYFCAHQLLAAKRTKEHAAPLMALYADVDGADLSTSPITPTAVVESSPGRFQAYARLACPVTATRGEQFNKRWALAFGADPSGYDLTQLLRVPGTRNHKYPDKPMVRLLEIDESTVYDPDELDKLLPKLPEPERKSGAVAESDIDKDDDALLQVMLRSQHGAKIRALLDNDTETLVTYPELLTEGRLDTNKADLSAVNFLAFYYGTQERADAAFRRSKRMRDKWNEKHRADGAIYGQMTLEKAFQDRTAFYTPAGDGPDLADGLTENQAAVEEAEKIIAGATDCTEHQAALEKLRSQLDACRQQGLEYKHQLDAVKTVLRNKHLAAGRKVVGIVAIFELDRKERRNPGENHLLYRAAIGERAGVSESAAGDALEALAGPGGIFEKQTVYKTFPQVNRQTGEVTDRRRRVCEFRPRQADPAAALHTLAAYAPEPEPGKAAWGGKRTPRCASHPYAGIEHYESFRCKTCKRLLAGHEYVPTDHEGDLYEQVAPIETPAGSVVTTKGQDAPIGPTAPRVMLAGARSPDADYRFDPVEVEQSRRHVEAPVLARETLAIGGPLGFPPLPVNGTILRGRQEWERLAEPSMLPHLPAAYRAAEYLVAQRAQANGGGS